MKGTAKSAISSFSPLLGLQWGLRILVRDIDRLRGVARMLGAGNNSGNRNIQKTMHVELACVPISNAWSGDITFGHIAGLERLRSRRFDDGLMQVVVRAAQV